LEGKTAKAASEVTVGPKQAPMSKSKNPANPTQPSQPNAKGSSCPIQPNQLSIDISDFLYNLTFKSC